MLSERDSFYPFNDQSLPGYQELIFIDMGTDWENSVASSDQAGSLADEEMKDLDI